MYFWVTKTTFSLQLLVASRLSDMTWYSKYNTLWKHPVRLCKCSVVCKTFLQDILLDGPNKENGSEIIKICPASRQQSVSSLWFSGLVLGCWRTVWDSSLFDYSKSLLTARQTFVPQTFCFSYWYSSKVMAKGRPHCHKTPRSHRQNRRCFRQVPVHRTSPPCLWWLTRKGPLCCSQLLCSSSRPYVSMSRRCKCMGGSKHNYICMCRELVT